MLALVSVYGTPNLMLLQLSHYTIKSCKYLGNLNLLVINVKTIQSVVTMNPHKITLPGAGVAEECFFVAKKPGLEAVEMGGVDRIVKDDEPMYE